MRFMEGCECPCTASRSAHGYNTSHSSLGQLAVACEAQGSMIDWLEPTQRGRLVVLPHNLHVVFPSMEMTETAFLPFSLELNGRTLTATLTDDMAAEFPPLSLLPTRRRYNSRELPATHTRSEATYDFATDTKRLGIGREQLSWTCSVYRRNS